MKHLTQNARSVMKSLLLIAAASAAFLHAEAKQELDWSEIAVNGRSYKLRLTEFVKPVEVGVGSPVLEGKYRDLLGTYAIISDPIKFSYEEACKVATSEVVGKLTREKYDRIGTTAVKANPALFQKAVDYAVEVQPKPAGRKYLVIAHRYGYNLSRVDENQSIVYSILIWDQGGWKSFPPVSDEVKVIQEDIKFARLVNIKTLIAGIKSPE